MNGRLSLFRSQAEMEREIKYSKPLGEYGVKSRILNAAEAKYMETCAQPDVVGGIFLENFAHLSPDRFVFITIYMRYVGIADINWRPV